jgi:hypothetical protein
MKFCTRCGSRIFDQGICGLCGRPAHGAWHRTLAAENAPAGDLPPFKYIYRVPLLGLLERERRVAVPFSYINGTLLDVRSYEDAAHPIHFKLWSQMDDPRSGPRGPIVGRESQPNIRSIVRLRLADGAERSFVLSQATLRSKAESPVTLIFPVSIDRASNPIYDYSAIAAVDYVTNRFTWSTANPEIHAIRSRLPGDQIEPFGHSLANHLNGLCRRCLRLFGQHQNRRPFHLAAAHEEAMR